MTRSLEDYFALATGNLIASVKLLTFFCSGELTQFAKTNVSMHTRGYSHTYLEYRGHSEIFAKGAKPLCYALHVKNDPGKPKSNV